MAIIATDLILRLSGGASNSDPDLALGGIMSTTTAINPVVAEENLFNNVDGAEALAGSTKYRGLYLLNNHGTITLNNSVAWLPSNTPSTDTAIRIALDLAGVNVTMDTVADEDTAPAPAVTWAAAATKGAGITTGAVPATQFYGIWFERVVTAAASAFNDDDWAVEWEGDTAAS